MQPRFIVLETLANGTQRTLNAAHLPVITAQKNAHYVLLDATTGKIPDGLIMQREGNALKVLVNNETVVHINEFYNQDLLAEFTNNGEFAINDDALISSEYSEPASLVGAASGDAFSGISTAQSIYSLGMLVAVSGGIAVAQKKEDKDDYLAPSAPIIALANDSGISDSDGITNDPTVTVSGIKEGASWEYSTDGGTTWLTGVGNSFELEVNTSYAVGSIMVHQIDSFNNKSIDVVNVIPITIDTEAPTIAFTHAAYDDVHNLIFLTGTNVNSLLENNENSTTNLAAKMDWSKLQWDANSDNTDNITFAEGDIENMVALNDTTLVIELTSTKATAIETSPDYGPTIPDILKIETGFSKDTVGNISTTDGFNSEPFTSTVIFDLVSGQSSSHSNRTFDANTSYTIFIMVNSDTGTGTGMIQPPKWTEGGALGADDTIVLTGNGSPIIGELNGHVGGADIRSSTAHHDMVVTWTTGNIGGWALRFNLHDGLITRFPLTSNFSQNIYLWNSSNSHSHSLQIGYMTNLPAGALTSQGLV